MNITKLKIIVGLLIDNGQQPMIRPISAVEFAVSVSSETGAPVATIQNIATNQGVNAIVRDVEFL